MGGRYRPNSTLFFIRIERVSGLAVYGFTDGYPWIKEEDDEKEDGGGDLSLSDLGCERRASGGGQEGMKEKQWS
ncbi:hypothetical protein A2U01_0056241, partial [Trifolium medium]|nr:hypothetical protein [Trifolium medium]